MTMDKNGCQHCSGSATSEQEQILINDERLGQLVLEHPSYKELEDKLLQAEQKASENLQNWLMATAELENSRRRTEREMANIHKYAIEKFANDLLPVVDNLERALTNRPTSVQGLEDLYRGVELTLKNLLETLGKYQIVAIDPRGETFNPERHTAVTVRERQAEESGNIVVEVIQKGYYLKERLLRPALVVVTGH